MTRDRWTITNTGSTSRLEDHHTQTVHDATFVPGPAGDLFVGVHRPTRGDPTEAVVICPPILAEAARNYRREWLVATELARTGRVAVRLHYRGAGHSVEARDATLQDLVADARAVVDHVIDRTGIRQVAFLGTRVGALVAAAARRASDLDGPVVLWQPVVEGRAYLRELQRARLMTNLRDDPRGRRLPTIDDVLSNHGAVELAGHHLGRTLYESLGDVQLAERLAPPSGSLLVIEMNGRLQVRPDVRALVDTWARAGRPAAVEVVPVDEPWWFGSSARADTYDAVTTGIELVARTLSFLGDRQGVPA